MSGFPVPSPRDLPNPEIEPEPPTLQVGSLPSKLPEKFADFDLGSALGNLSNGRPKIRSIILLSIFGDKQVF